MTPTLGIDDSYRNRMGARTAVFGPHPEKENDELKKSPHHAGIFYYLFK